MNENIDEILDKPVSSNFIQNELNAKYDDRTFWSHKKFFDRDYFRRNNEAYFKNKSIEEFYIEKEFDSILGKKSVVDKYDPKPVIQRSRDAFIHPPIDGFKKNFISTGRELSMMKKQMPKEIIMVSANKPVETKSQPSVLLMEKHMDNQSTQTEDQTDKEEKKDNGKKKNKNKRQNIIIIIPCFFVLILVSAGVSVGVTYGITSITSVVTTPTLIATSAASTISSTDTITTTTSITTSTTTVKLINGNGNG